MEAKLTINMNRRDFLKTVGSFLLVAGVNPGSLFAKETSDDSQLEQKLDHLFSTYGEFDTSLRKREKATIYEFAEFYGSDCLNTQNDLSEVNILYPGSGFDLTPLVMGLKLLNDTPTKEVNLVYTEIGNYMVSENAALAWHEGQNDLISKIENGDLDNKTGGLKRFVELGLLTNLNKNVNIEGEIVNDGNVYQVSSIKYQFEVPTNQGTKNLSLTISYNQSPNRPELSEEEIEFFGEEFIERVRGHYWPKPGNLREGVIYPQYAQNSQFADANIILSKMCGDQALLEFDYLKAMLSAPRKQRVVLTEHPSSTFLKNHSLPGYTPKIHTLVNNHFGYADGGDDKVGALILTPNN